MHLYAGDNVVLWSYKSARRVWSWDSVSPHHYSINLPFFPLPFSVTFSFTSSHLGSCGLVSTFHFHSSLLYPSLSLLSWFPSLSFSFFYFLKTSLLSLCFHFTSFSSSNSYPYSLTSFESFTRPLSHWTYLSLVDWDLLLLYCFSSTLS